MNLKARRLKSGRWAIYNGTVRYITTSYPTKAKAQERIRVELQWGSRGISLTSTHPSHRRVS